MPPTTSTIYTNSNLNIYIYIYIYILTIMMPSMVPGQDKHCDHHDHPRQGGRTVTIEYCDAEYLRISSVDVIVSVDID